MPENPPRSPVSDATQAVNGPVPLDPIRDDVSSRIVDGSASMAPGAHGVTPSLPNENPALPTLPELANTHHLSSAPWDMFLQADLVVQAVMVLLVLASIATWTILLVKGLEIIIARRALSASLRAAQTDDGMQALRQPRAARIARALLAAAEDEVMRSEGLPVEGIKDRIALRLRRIEHGATRRMGRGTGILASIGASAPFIGLFGPGWGIMNSFRVSSRAKATSLASVAPGIAEALLATAFGLAAAIPAVLTYNAFARALAGYRAELSDLSTLVLAHAARELDRGQVPRQSMAHPIRLRPAAE